MISYFPLPLEELNIERTVMSGQAFRWHVDHRDRWSCVLQSPDGPQWLRLSQDPDKLAYETAPIPGNFALVHDYFRLDVPLVELTREFAAMDPAIAMPILAFPGLRVLRQDPVENLFSFLCTSAAPLHRIRKSISGLCRAYGDPFPPPVFDADISHAFPTLERLSEATISEMMEMGLGYRARYVKAAAHQILEYGGRRWLEDLRNQPYAEAKAALLTLTGVGEKIADCVCLFSLDKDEAIPVDTHIRQIAERDFLAKPSGKTLTRHSYAEIGNLLRDRFGPMAGWAQQYLFLGDLFEKGAWKAYTSQYRPPMN